MPSVLENPVLLLALSLVVLCVVGTIRAVFPEKPRYWLFIFPVSVALAGLGIDYFIQTDSEKVRVTVKEVMKAVENEDIPHLARWLADNYQDSLHRSKTQLLQHAEEGLERSQLVKANITGLSIPSIQGVQSKAFITTHLNFSPESYVAQYYKPTVIVEIEFYLQTGPDEKWLINRIEITEIDKQSLRWQHIQGRF